MDQHTTTETAFLKLHEEFADAIYRHCYYRVSSQSVAEDLTQESFMRVWDYLSSGKKVDNPKAFLYRIASNLVIDYYRKKKETSLDVLSEAGFDPAGEDEQSILTYAEGQVIPALLAKLEPDYREVLVMRYVDDLTIGEIAQAIGESDNVVSVRIHRGVAKLKTLFNHGTH
ncbi:MAG: polymerase sigma factor, sigma-70 family [Parcubacteria group bacterium]|nr:polymerase sigma factor, sigma-70 family [Parcubacteria group bacterium]